MGGERRAQRSRAAGTNSAEMISWVPAVTRRTVGTGRAARPSTAQRCSVEARRRRASRPLRWPEESYQVPLTQPPFTPEVGVHVRVIAPPVRVIENVLLSVEVAVTV